MRKRIESIADFAGIGDFFDAPLRTYSAGMMVRLAFATATSVDADILLMDEWLSVGDAEFSKKAAERLERLVDRTPILVMASHDPTLIGRMCNRVFRLEHGTMTEELQGIQVRKTVTS